MHTSLLRTAAPVGVAAAVAGAVLGLNLFGPNAGAAGTAPALRPGAAGGEAGDIIAVPRDTQVRSRLNGCLRSFGVDAEGFNMELSNQKFQSADKKSLHEKFLRLPEEQRNNGEARDMQATSSSPTEYLIQALAVCNEQVPSRPR